MIPADAFHVSSWALAAILAATAVSYLCRIGGYWAMGFVTPSPRIQRALNALPGSIVAAVVLPAIAQTGFVAAIAVATAIGAKIVARSDILGLIVGLGVTIGLRAMGF